MRLRILSFAIALLAAPLTAEAQPFHGLHVVAGAGYNLPQNDPLAHRDHTEPHGEGGAVEPNGGVVGLGSVGYAVGSGFRFEVEGNYRHAERGRTGTTFGSN